MSEVTPIQILLAVVALLNTLFAAAAFVRVGRWRDSDAGKQISTDINELKNVTTSDEGGTIKADIHKIRNDLTKIEVRLATAEKASDKVSSIEGRITGIETTLQHMASRADIESVKSELGGVEDQVRAAAAGVVRIEAFLMERAG